MDTTSKYLAMPHDILVRVRVPNSKTSSVNTK